MSEMSPLEKLVEATKVNPMDRENWINLGKALGWAKPCYSCKKPVVNDNDGHGGCCGWLHEDEYGKPAHVYHMHRFIDWIAEGKSPDSFFEQLIKQHEDNKV